MLRDASQREQGEEGAAAGGSPLLPWPPLLLLHDDKPS